VKGVRDGDDEAEIEEEFEPRRPALWLSRCTRNRRWSCDRASDQFGVQSVREWPPSADRGDRRVRTDQTLLLVWVGQRASAHTHLHSVAGAEPAVRAQPRLEHLAAVEL
jgi:hypothetical protein